MKKVLLIMLSLFFTFGVKAEISIYARSGILIEPITGTILFAKNENTKMAPASMTKMMSLLLVMEQIETGNLNYDDKVIVSKEASSMGGSQVFLQEGDEYKVVELIKCVAMASANDAIVALAEKTYGSVDKFVEAMNKKVQDLDLKNTNFVNVHGIDEDNHYSTAYDMSMIARELIKYEDILEFSSKYEDYLTKIDGSQLWLVNTNKVVCF